MSSESRYDRQQRIENWDQSRLENATVGIIGDGQLAQLSAASLVALGIGNIEIYRSKNGNTSGFLNALSGGSLEETLRAMNPEINVRIVYSEENSLSDYLGRKKDLVIDLTNSSESKREILKYSYEKGADVISATSSKTGAAMYYVKSGKDQSDATLDDYNGKEQGGFSSEIMGGIIAEEVRKSLMPLREGEKPVDSIFYQATSGRRFSKYADFEAMPFEDLSKKKALIIGAGALGNFVALGSALEGIGEIDIMDYDDVEKTNLNRQILFYDSVGRSKAEALVEKLRKINPKIKVRTLREKLDENSEYFVNNSPDVIFDCVDSFATRAITNYFSVRNKIPLVSGGTNSSSGQVVVYEPGQSACLECKLGVEQSLGLQLAGSKCTDTPDPSVIMTNEVIGGMMVGEGLKVLDKGYGAAVDRILKYDSNVPVRGGLVGPSNSCDCERGDIKEWIEKLKERFTSVKGEK